MNNPRVVMVSFWRNDTQREIRRRMEHLTSKSYPNLRWMWVTGDNKDSTPEILHEFAFKNHNKDIEIVQSNTRIEGEGLEKIWIRLSQTLNFAFARVRANDEYVLHHESDLITDVDIVEKFLATGKCPIAGWPVISLPINFGYTDKDKNSLPPFIVKRLEEDSNSTIKLFYDTWAYRKDGVMFTNSYPYHSCYKPDEPFEVDSFGSCCMFHAEDIRKGLRVFNECLVEVCNKLRQSGRTCWVDPRIEVVHPYDMHVVKKYMKDIK